MIQKRSRIKINTDLAKIRQAGKNPQEVQKELVDICTNLWNCYSKNQTGRKKSAGSAERAFGVLYKKRI